MKDYFYFLGLSTEASEEDIKTAYRKLAAKYHPDKNNGDEFLTARFRELQEAYETLIDPEKRKIYQSTFATHRPVERSLLPPFIKTFSVSHVFLKSGDQVTIKWETRHADTVKLLPFGLVKPYGEKTIRVTEFKDGKFVLILHATNSYIQKTVVQGITLMEGEAPATDEPEFLRHGQTTVPPETLRKTTTISPRKIQGIVFLLFVLLALLYFLTQ